MGHSPDIEVMFWNSIIMQGLYRAMHSQFPPDTPHSGPQGTAVLLFLSILLCNFPSHSFFPSSYLGKTSTSAPYQSSVLFKTSAYTGTGSSSHQTINTDCRNDIYFIYQEFAAFMYHCRCWYKSVFSKIYGCWKILGVVLHSLVKQEPESMVFILKQTIKYTIRENKTAKLFWEGFPLGESLNAHKSRITLFLMQFSFRECTTFLSLLSIILTFSDILYPSRISLNFRKIPTY